MWNLPKDLDLTVSPELFYVGEATYYAAVATTKTSILLLYLKLSPNKSFRNLAYVMMAFVIGTAVGCIIANIFQCIPVQKVWKPELEGHCFNPTHLFYANAGLDMLQDLIIYLMPIDMLWKLKLPVKQRIGLIFIFIVGGFVVITGAIRVESLANASISEDASCKSKQPNYHSRVLHI